MPDRTTILRLLSLSVLALAFAGCTIYEDDGHHGGPPPEYPDAGWWPQPDADVLGLPDAAPWGDADVWPTFPDAGIFPYPDAGIFPYPDAGSWPTPDAGSTFRCSDITNEAVCVVTPGCNALYHGVDCTCDSTGMCVCDHWVFDRCD